MKYLLIIIVSVLAVGCYSTVSWTSLTQSYDRETTTVGRTADSPVYIFNPHDRNTYRLYYPHPYYSTWVTYPTYSRIPKTPTVLTPRTTGLSSPSVKRTRPKTEIKPRTSIQGRKDDKEGREGSKMRSRGSGDKKTRSLPPSL